MRMIIHVLVVLAIIVGSVGLKRIAPLLTLTCTPKTSKEAEKGKVERFSFANYAWLALQNSILAIFYAGILVWGLSHLNIHIFR